MDRIYPRSGDAPGDKVLGREVVAVYERHAYPAHGWFASEEVDGEQWIIAAWTDEHPLPESIITRQPRGKGDCSGTYIVHGHPKDDEPFEKAVCDREHGHEPPHGPAEQCGCGATYDLHVVKGRIMCPSCMMAAWATGQPPEPVEQVKCRECGQPIEGQGFGSAENGWQHPFSCPDEDQGTPVYILVHVKPDQFAASASPSVARVEGFLGAMMRGRYVDTGWYVVSVGTWDPYVSPPAKPYITLPNGDRIDMGKATWEWDDELNCQVPCCSALTNDVDFQKCGNGPLTGDEIAAGRCSQHAEITADTPGYDVPFGQSRPSAEPKVCGETYTPPGGGADIYESMSRNCQKPAGHFPATPHGPKEHPAAKRLMAEQESAVDPAIEAVIHTSVGVDSQMTRLEAREVAAAVDKARAEHAKPFGWWVEIVGSPRGGHFTRTPPGVMPGDTAIPLYLHPPKEA